MPALSRHTRPMASTIAAASTSEVVVPGDVLGDATIYTSGAGTYERAGRLYASMLGSKRVIESAPVSAETPLTAPAKQVMTVIREAAAAVIVPTVGSIVTAKITRITLMLANAEILVVNGKPVPDAFTAVIRRENVRDTEIDKIKMEECFKPGDLVRATIASLGDARSYLLSTARPDLGVIYALSDAGEVMVPANFEEYEVPTTGKREKRKVARPEL